MFGNTCVFHFVIECSCYTNQPKFFLTLPPLPLRVLKLCPLALHLRSCVLVENKLENVFWIFSSHRHHDFSKENRQQELRDQLPNWSVLAKFEARNFSYDKFGWRHPRSEEGLKIHILCLHSKIRGSCFSKSKDSQWNWLFLLSISLSDILPWYIHLYLKMTVMSAPNTISSFLTLEKPIVLLLSSLLNHLLHLISAEIKSPVYILRFELP